MDCELLGVFEWRALEAELDRLFLWPSRLQRRRDELAERC